MPAGTGPTSSPGYNYSQDSGNSSQYGRSPIEAILNRDLPKTALPAFFGLFGLAALLFYYYRIWLKVGRDPQSLKALAGVTVVVAPTREAARRKHEEILESQTPEITVASAKLSFVGGMSTERLKTSAPRSPL